MLRISIDRYKIQRSINPSFRNDLYMNICPHCKQRIIKYTCKLCKKELLAAFFYPKHYTKCIECFNNERRESYPASICQYCHISFKPKSKGHYEFCSEKCRFLMKVDQNGPNGCWIWIGGYTSRGYGAFVPVGKKSGLAHRESYRIFKGALHEGYCIMHTCDNPKCVNPDHLKIGTNKDNTQDAIRKGRMFPKNLLTRDEVNNILLLHKDGMTIDSIAKIYMRQPGTISDVINNKTYKKFKR